MTNADQNLFLLLSIFSCLKPPLWPINTFNFQKYRFLSRFTHQGRASHFVRETFRQRKRETDPRLIKQYVYEAEQFVAQWERAEPAPADMYSRGGALYQRNDPFPEIYLRPEAHVDFEELNKLESESDYYIARYKKSQQEALEQTFGGDKSKKTL